MGTIDSLKFQVYRSNAMRLALDAFCRDVSVREREIDVSQISVGPITLEAIHACANWNSPSLYPWEDVLAWKNRDKKSFDMAIWFGEQLCGLCFATPRKSTIRIKVILLEGKPDPMHPLKGAVMSLAVSAVGYYAKALGLKFIEIEAPSQGAIPSYQRVGFDFDGRGRLVISLTGA